MRRTSPSTRDVMVNVSPITSGALAAPSFAGWLWAGAATAIDDSSAAAASARFMTDDGDARMILGRATGGARAGHPRRVGSGWRSIEAAGDHGGAPALRRSRRRAASGGDAGEEEPTAVRA